MLKYTNAAPASAHSAAGQLCRIICHNSNSASTQLREELAVVASAARGAAVDAALSLDLGAGPSCRTCCGFFASMSMQHSGGRDWLRSPCCSSAEQSVHKFADVKAAQRSVGGAATTYDSDNRVSNHEYSATPSEERV